MRFSLAQAALLGSPMSSLSQLGILRRGGTGTHDFARVEPNEVILFLQHTIAKTETTVSLTMIAQLLTLSNLEVHRHAGWETEEASRMSRNTCRHT